MIWRLLPWWNFYQVMRHSQAELLLSLTSFLPPSPSSSSSSRMPMPRSRSKDCKEGGFLPCHATAIGRFRAERTKESSDPPPDLTFRLPPSLPPSSAFLCFSLPGTPLCQRRPPLFLGLISFFCPWVLRSICRPNLAAQVVHFESRCQHFIRVAVSGECLPTLCCIYCQIGCPQFNSSRAFRAIGPKGWRVGRGNDELMPVRPVSTSFTSLFEAFTTVNPAECNFANFIGRFRIVKDPLTVTINYSANDS